MSNDFAGVIMLGCGGHARVIQELLAIQGTSVIGFVAPDSQASRLIDVPWLGPAVLSGEQDRTADPVVNGVGSTGLPSLRRAVFEQAAALGARFASVVDSSASIRPSAVLGAGSQVLPGAIIGTGVSLGDNVLVNSGAIVEHDSVIGAHSHISPGAALAGGVRVGHTTHVGLGARVVQGVTIGSGCIVGAGAVVLRDVPDGHVAVGVPASSRLPVSRSTDARS